MNLSGLHHTITDHLSIIRPAVDSVFDPIIKRAPKRVNASTFIEHLNDAFKTQNIVGLRIRSRRDKDEIGSAARGTFYPSIEGYCIEPIHSEKCPTIRVVLCLDPTTRRLSLTTEAWEHFRFRLLEIIAHELVHRAQYYNGRRGDNSYIFRPHAAHKIGTRLFKEQAYFGDLDEVEAYGRDCVEEWYYRYPDIPLTPKLLKADFVAGGTLRTLRYYHAAFVGDLHHPAIRRLFRKVRQWNLLITPLATSLPKAPAYLYQS